MSLFEEIEGRLRGMILRFKPTSIDDAGARQRAAGTMLRNVHRSNVEVAQPFGFASTPPPGSSMIVFAIGGDQGDLVALPCTAPEARMGNLAPGEAAIYGLQGQRVHCKADGSVDVQSAVKVTMKAPQLVIECEGCTVTIDSTGIRVQNGGIVTQGGPGIDVNGGGINLTGGTITHDGKNIGSTHRHGGVQPGGGTTGSPT